MPLALPSQHPPQPRHHLFISYASADEAATLAFVRQVEQRALTCWISKRDVRPGTDYQEEIVSAIADATHVLLMLSERSNASREIPKEMAIARQRRKPVIPVRLENVFPAGALAYQFTNAQFVDLFRDYDQGIDRLCRHLGREIAASADVERGLRRASWRRFARQWLLPAGVAALIVTAGLGGFTLVHRLGLYADTAPSHPRAAPTGAAASDWMPPAAAQPDTNVPATMTPETASRALALRYYSAISGNEAVAIAFVDTYAAASVRYYGQILTKGKFMAAARKQFVKWPDRTFTVEPASVSSSCVSTTCRVTGEVRYVLQNDGGKTSGRERFAIDVAGRGRGLALTGLATSEQNQP